MALIQKVDQEITQAFQAQGVTPEGMFYTVQQPPFLVMILLLGGLLSVFFQTPYMAAIQGDTLTLIETSKFKTSTLTDKVTRIKRSDIVHASVGNFGPAKHFILRLQDGKKMRLVCSTLYRGLEGQGQGIEKFKSFLNV